MHPQVDPTIVVFSGRWNSVEDHDPPGLDLYDLQADFQESMDCSTTQPAVPQQLQQSLTDWKLQVRAEPTLPNQNFDEAVRAT